jgi:hypothetical protein
MSLSRISTGFSVACVIAAVSACGSGRDNTAGQSTNGDRSLAQRSDATAERRSGDTDKTSITVAGCLQKGDGNAFILTRVNQPEQSVGTGGTSEARVVERERLRAAAGSYRVDPPPDVRAEGLVGKEVRIIGTVSDNADLPRPSDERRGNGADINQSDLARIAATSITATRDACQGSESPSAGATGDTSKR